MTESPRHLLLAVLAAALVAAWGCDGGGGGGGEDDDDDDNDNDNDDNDDGAADADSDGDADSDADADADADADSDSDSDADCAEDYPAGPYNWFEGDVVSAVGFPGRLGPSGADGELHMCDAHANSATVKSLVFAVGANT